MKVIIHASGVGWHRRYLQFFVEGFTRHGVKEIEPASQDIPVDGDIHILFGPNYWKNCEKQYDNYLQVNRKFFGDVNDDVAISWNGFNGRGIFNIDPVDPPRYRAFEDAMSRNVMKIHPWREFHRETFLLCGQADLGRATNWARLSEWYAQAREHFRPAKCNFRPHPNGDGRSLLQDSNRSGFAVTLNSTVAIETLMLGLPTAASDKGSPVWAICNPERNPLEEPPRGLMFEYLANCQWHYDDIKTGEFWEILRPGPTGPRLCDVPF